MKKIVIVGYPKSGNTWLTRLVAELINCPVDGFWNSDREEMAQEGLSRKNEYACYKSHHQLKELQAITEKPERVIYVIRDPRDVALSGKNYFRSIDLIDQEKARLKFLAKIINKLFYYVIGNDIMKKKMIQAVLYGDSTVNRWCKISWKAHLMPYLESEEICKVTYESMLDNPREGCKKILHFLGLKRSKSEIEAAIEKQSFARVKQKFKENRDYHKANFLRRGGRNYWVKSLSKKEKQLFVTEIGEELNYLGYPVNSP